jgi:hypothetical protein
MSRYRLGNTLLCSIPVLTHGVLLISRRRLGKTRIMIAAAISGPGRSRHIRRSRRPAGATGRPSLASSRNVATASCKAQRALATGERKRIMMSNSHCPGPALRRRRRSEAAPSESESGEAASWPSYRDIGREKSGLLRVSAYILPAASRDAAQPAGFGKSKLLLFAESRLSNPHWQAASAQASIASIGKERSLYSGP